MVSTQTDLSKCWDSSNRCDTIKKEAWSRFLFLPASLSLSLSHTHAGRCVCIFLLDLNLSACSVAVAALLFFLFFCLFAPLHHRHRACCHGEAWNMIVFTRHAAQMAALRVCVCLPACFFLFSPCPPYLSISALKKKKIISAGVTAPLPADLLSCDFRWRPRCLHPAPLLPECVWLMLSSPKSFVRV